MNIIPLFFSILLFFTFCGSVYKDEATSEYLSTSLLDKHEIRGTSKVEESVALIDDLKIKEAAIFCKKQKLDTNIAFFADMSIHSGKARFFVFDFQNKKIIYSGLCCHGMGLGSTCTNPIFSNEKGSNCTSLGKYKTGLRSYSNWGINIHYKMHGLEANNCNAFQRIVVLHSYDQVPEVEIFPEHLPLGWSQGCPVISNGLMTSIDQLLKYRKRPVLLMIYI